MPALGNAIGLPFLQRVQSLRSKILKILNVTSLLFDEKEGLTSTQVVDAKGDETRPVRKGRVYNFDGAGDYVDLPISLDGASSYEIKLYVDDQGASNSQYFDTRDSGGDGVYIGQIAGTLRCAHNSNTISTSLVPADYTHKEIKITWDGTTLELFVDGVSEGSTSATDSLVLTGNATLGKSNFSSAQYFDGGIYDVNVTKDGVNIGQYHCEEEAGLTALDASGNGNHGTIVTSDIVSFHAIDNC